MVDAIRPATNVTRANDRAEFAQTRNAAGSPDDGTAVHLQSGLLSEHDDGLGRASRKIRLEYGSDTRWHDLAASVDVECQGASCYEDKASDQPTHKGNDHSGSALPKLSRQVSLAETLGEIPHICNPTGP